MLNDLDTQKLRQQFETAEPFRWICIDNFLKPEVARAVANSYPEHQKAEELGLSFNAVNERNKVQITDPEKFPTPVKELADHLATEGFRQLLSEITGIDELLWDDSFAGAGMHQTSTSGRLDVHVDFNRLDAKGLYRRLNLLLYLNEEWQDSWGGKIELWDKDVKKCHYSAAPLLNRCVIFETSDVSFHGVTQLACPPNVVRRSFALYFYTKEPAAHMRFGDHTTIFRARPDEPLRRYVLMPAERAGRTLKMGLRRVKHRAARAVGLR